VNALPSLTADARRLRREHTAYTVISAAVFTVAYLSWRPFEILLTLSDLLFAIGFVLLLRCGRLPVQPIGTLTGLWLICIVIMLAGLFLGSVVNGDPARWLIVAMQYMFSLAVLPMLLMPRDEQASARLLLAFVAGIAVMQALGAAVYFLFPGDFVQVADRFGHAFISPIGRLGAFLGDANWNAAMCAMALPVTLYLLVVGRIGPRVAAALFLALGTGTLLAGSVSGFVSAIVSLLIVGMACGVRRAIRFVMAAGVVVLLYAVSGAPLPRAFANRVAPALEQVDLNEAGTFAGRLELIEEAWAMTDRTLIVGLGVDQYRTFSVQQAPVHNIYLLLWTEGGLFALLGWLGLMGLAVGIAVLAAVRDRLTGGLAASVLVVFFIQSTANPHMYARMWIVPVLIVTGIAFQVGRRGRPQPLLEFKGRHAS
jgi:O-Antigen ligase